MAVFSQNDSVLKQHALTSAEAALSRIQKYAEAARQDRITASEALEQILDELEARATLGKVREALGRGAQQTRAH